MITEQQDKALRSIGCEYTYPDIDKAIRWMREVKGVHVAVLPAHDKWYYIVCVGDNDTIEDGAYQSHDLAQSAGLDAAIEYVKREQL